MADSKYADTLKALGKLLGSSRGRHFFQANGYIPGTPIIPALENDLVGEVMRAGNERSKSFLIAVIIDGDMQIINVSDASTAPERMTRRNKVHVNSDIGMLFHAVALDSQVGRYQLVSGQPASPVGVFSRAELATA